jgi:polyphosphate kinase 2 (PPK2 family)
MTQEQMGKLFQEFSQASIEDREQVLRHGPWARDQPEEEPALHAARYIQQFPAGGEIVIFDRSWYNRAGVEYVMGFCSEHDHERFLKLCPQVEKYMAVSR